MPTFLGMASWSLSCPSGKRVEGSPGRRRKASAALPPLDERGAAAPG
jgi:hypothetical protein